MSDDRNDEAATFEQHSMTGMSEIVSEAGDTFAGVRDASGPDGPAKRKKPGRGRPRLEDVARRKTAERVARWRAKQNNPVGIKKQWQQNLAALGESERLALAAKQEQVADLVDRMNDVVIGVGFGSGTGVAGDTMYFPDLVFQDVHVFLDQPGNELVDSWVPDSVAVALTAQDWHSFDDATYKTFGLRTKIVNLFWRETLANIFIWSDSHQDETEPGVLDQVTKEIASRVPLEMPKYIPEPTVFIPEKEREEKIRAHEELEDQQQRFQNEFLRYQLGQLDQEAK
jgi:hypothetical protein